MKTLGKLVLACALMASVGVTSAQASEFGVQHAPCGKNGTFSDGVTRQGGTSGARIRTGSSTSCTGRGSILPSHSLTFWCTTRGTDGYYWTYLENINTKVRGWTRNNLLPNNGTHIECAF